MRYAGAVNRYDALVESLRGARIDTRQTYEVLRENVDYFPKQIKGF